MSIIEKKIKILPNQPGCYLYKNKSGKIIYIGKAKNLKKRVKSYFQNKLHDAKTNKLVSEIVDVDFIVTDTELEALLLEAKLIKENQPQYNIELKGGVRYAYIKITNEMFPRLETVRFFKSKDKIFGPYALSSTRKNLILLSNNLFKLRTGKSKPQKAGNRYKIKCSTQPWTRIVDESQYSKDIAKAELLLKGNMTPLISQLKKEMQKFSDEQQYELAKIRRDQIIALENLKQEQKVQLKKAFDQDVVNAVIVKNKFIVQLFNITKGVVSGRKQFKFNVVKDQTLPKMLGDFVKQYYYSNELPQEIIIPEKIDQAALLEKYLETLARRKVRLIIPKQGDKLKLLELVKKNILVGLKRGDAALFELQQKLKLPKLPETIECFDVSNLGDNFIVGSMVHFKNGLPDKNNYRRFRIKWQSHQSDFDAIKEIIYRRYFRLKAENQQLPDLILIDGGKSQLTAGLQAIKSLGLKVNVASLAKKQEEIFLPYSKYSIRIAKSSDALKLVQKIRDEAHRFAITYNRLLRRKNI